MTAAIGGSDRSARPGEVASWPPTGPFASPRPPLWVHELLGDAPRAAPVIARERLAIWRTEASAASWVEAVVRSASELDDPAFERAAAELYEAVGQLLRARGESPLRFWNYIPGIRRAAGEGLRRYEVFNAGRFRGFERWKETGESASRFVASSGVGGSSEDFVVHVLTGPEPGRPLENPRQRPAYRYSRRYGPLPPYFSRATVLSRPLPTASGPIGVLVAGTASVVGEDSKHPANLGAQVHEIRRNLAAIWAAVGGESAQEAPLERILGHYRHLRMYLVEESHASEAAELLCSGLSPAAGVEIVVADLCRPELLVEVEGTLPPRS